MFKWLLILFILSFLILLIHNNVESFVETNCSYTDCKSCSSSSGCSWCPKKHICIMTNYLKNEDVDCNVSNTFTNSSLCGLNPNASEPLDFNLYHDLISNKIPPPNIYTNSNMEYSPETVMAQTTHIQNDIQSQIQKLPDVIVSAINIKKELKWFI